LASPECTNHSPAKGNKPRCEVSKNTAFEVVRFADKFKPRWIVVENVVSMRRWPRYREFMSQLQALGFHLREQVLDSASFGVPQTRRRLFLLCDRERLPDPIPTLSGRRKSARSIVNLNGTFRWSPLHTERRAAATLERAERGIREVGENTPFLLVYYGSDHAGGWQQLSRPLRTITTLDRFALVKPSPQGHLMRMLQVPELQSAMGMDGMRFEHGTRRDRIKMLGNAVCPPVMRAVIKHLKAT
jgi:DNA (cytosine-5)-methyltransferase 1